MTARELIEMADREPWLLLGLVALPPLLAWLLGFLHGSADGRKSPWKYAYSLLVYLACVPGMLAVVLCAYTLFFLRESLLDVSLLVYFLPVVSMVVTLVVVQRRIAFAALPGTDRLWGFLLTMGCSMAVALAIQKTNIWVFFGGSIEKMLLLALVVFALARWGGHLMFRRRRATP